LQRKIFFTNIPNGSPVPYLGITAKFGWRIHPILKKKEYHPGLDMRAKSGEKVRAPADGLVEFAGYHKRSGYGNLIILDHNYGFKTLYGHLKKVLVKNNQFVKKGQVIGLVGNTGLSTGHHLHYGIMYLQKFLNPYYFVKWNNKNFDYIFKKERRVRWQYLIKAIQSQIQLLSQQGQK
jgi:murein DD-endopeptidase MepM/ murein hydrolase activator NlpD